jgi:dolichol-phosphate mannosyltransferase
METTWQVPAFDVARSEQRASRYAVCVFVLNEGEKVRKQLLQMRQFAGIADIIVADGGSTDEAFEGSILEEARVSALLVKTGSGKLSAQMRMAMAW